MNVSPVSANTMSFGAVKKSAAEKAMQMANGSRGELSRIKDAIAGQKDNERYDVVGLPSHEYYNFMVCKKGEHGGQCFMELDEACGFATRSNDRDAAQEAREAKKAQEKPEFDQMAEEILAECEE